MTHHPDGTIPDAGNTHREGIDNAANDHSQQPAGNTERPASKADQMIALLINRTRSNDTRR